MSDAGRQHEKKEEQRESVDYDLVRQGMEAGEQAARESRSRRSLKPRIWAILLIIAAILITRLLSG